LGYAYLQKQDFTQASEYFRRSSDQDSKDPRVHYYNALLMAQESGFTSKLDLPALTKELETSVSLDPNFADSYALLAFAQSTSGDHEKALATLQKAIAIDPRNENFRFNMANIYLLNRQPDKAMAILQSLRNSTNPQLASQVASAMESIRQFQQFSKPDVTLVHRGEAENPTVAAESSQLTSSNIGPGPKWGAPIFLRGTINAVDCSSDPSAILAVSSGSKTVKLKIADKHQLILIGADEFSCSWTNKKVAVNYRQDGGGETNVMSLELQ
jgi:tetratricopeptide (TPR) repeat protein